MSLSANDLKIQLKKIRESNRDLNIKNKLLESEIRRVDAQINRFDVENNETRELIDQNIKAETKEINTLAASAENIRRRNKKNLIYQVNKYSEENRVLEADVSFLRGEIERLNQIKKDFRALDTSLNINTRKTRQTRGEHRQ